MHTAAQHSRLKKYVRSTIYSSVDGMVPTTKGTNKENPMLPTYESFVENAGEFATVVISALAVILALSAVL
jgi:hypothetical protein